MSRDTGVTSTPKDDKMGVQPSDAPVMRALTVKQPWANLIIRGGKDVENRDWPTAFRGRVAIHSSLTADLVDIDSALEFYERTILRATLADYSMWGRHRDRGCIVGTVEIYGCVKRSESLWFEGRHGFLLRNPIALATPIPCRGALGFWDVPESIAAQVAAQL